MLAGSSVVFIILFIATFAYMKPVQFEDKNLENLIRITLNNPDRPIYKHQLLTIAFLDGTYSIYFQPGRHPEPWQHRRTQASN